MTYVRLDDKMPEHPKVARLSDRAFRIHVQGICYCQRNLSNGIVPKYVADAWGKRCITTELVPRGLWIDVNADDYEIHDFLEWNDSKESIESRRGKDLERKKDSRRNPDGIPIDTASIDTASAVVVVGLSEDEEFAAFYALFPRHERPRAARTAFVRARKRASLEEMCDGARRYRDDPNRDASFTLHPATWLNGDGWLSEPLPPRSAGKARSVSNILALAEHAEGSA